MRSALGLLVLAACLDSAPPPPDPAPVAFEAVPMLKRQPPQFDLERKRARELPQEPETPAELRFGDFDLHPAIRDGRLSLVPISTRGEPDHAAYTTLQAGLASGEVVATERGAVEAITVTNKSDRPLAILGGELVVEGHQDRLIVRNTVIPPHRTQAVATVCAELGRSSGGERFKASHAIAEPTLRRLARSTDQFAVWDQIDRVVGGETGLSYRYAAHRQKLGTGTTRLRSLVNALDEVGNTVGFVVAIDDKVIAVEHFASPELYRALRGMVIASYLPSSAGTQRGTPKQLGATDVQAFIRRTGEGGQVPPRNRAATPSAATPVR